MGQGIPGAVGDLQHHARQEGQATVGGTKITLGEFQRAYQRQSQALSRQIGQALTPDMARSIGLPQQTLGALMADATVADMAAATGLGVSDERLRRRGDHRGGPGRRRPGRAGPR